MKKYIKLISLIISALMAFSAISFGSVAESTILGDVNSDSEVNATDVLYLKNYVAEKYTNNDMNFTNADVNKDSDVTILDLLYLRKKLANIITDFSSVEVDQNLLDDVSNQLVVPENLGIPGAIRYPSTSSYYYARNIWDMKVVDGKVLLSMGDYGTNTGTVPIYYYTNDSSSPHDNSYLSTSGVSVDGLSAEQISRFFTIDGDVYAVATDPLGMGQGSYYKYNSNLNTWQDYNKLPLNVHCYDMVEFDGKIFFAGMVRDNQKPNMIVHCVQYLDKTKLNTSSSATNLDFYYEDGTKYYINDDYTNTYTSSDYWRSYDMFVFKGELYAAHYYTGATNYEGLFKYDNSDPDNLKFVRVSDKNDVNGFTSVLNRTTKSTYQYINGSWQKLPVYYDIGNEHIFSEPMCGAKISTDDKLVLVYNSIFVSTDALTYDLVTLGTGYENYVTRDAIEVNGKYYFVASQLNDDGTYTNAVFESTDFENFRRVLYFDSETFIRSFEYNAGYMYFGCGCNGKIDNVTDSGTTNAYSGTLYRVDLNDYID